MYERKGARHVCARNCHKIISHQPAFDACAGGKLRYVASTAQTSLSDFILASALERADQMLEDRTEFVATDEDFERLLEALDAPLPTIKIQALAARPSPVGSTLTWTD